MTDRYHMRQFASLASSLGCLLMLGCADATSSPAPAETGTPSTAPSRTSSPIEVVPVEPYDSVLEALVTAQLTYPDVFSSAELAGDGSLRLTYDESSIHAASFVDFVEENSSREAVIHWADGGFPIQRLPDLGAEAFGLAEAAGFEPKGGSLSTDGSTFFVFSPSVDEDQTVGFVSMNDQMIEIVVQGGDSVAEAG